MPGKLLTYEQLSERWGVAVNTLRIWKMKGVLVPMKLAGHLVRFPESHILDLEKKWSEHAN